MSKFVSRELIGYIRAQFALDWHGIHGVSHWVRVRINGLAVANHNGADPRLVELFAFLHDARRLDDGYDLQHGPRAARWIESLNGRFFQLDAGELKLLQTAIAEHSEGKTRGERTVIACWDADRLDLGRIGIKPDPQYLCTAYARLPATIERAYARSTRQMFEMPQ